MTITQLEYVVAVDTYRNFALAADKCFVTQPTLSMQIKKLEEELNLLIFDRSKKPVLPTDIGAKIIKQARASLRSFGKIGDIINDERHEISGELRIGVIPTISPYLLPMFMIDFTKKYSGIDLVVEELLSEQIIKKLQNDQLDVGIMASPINESGIIEMPLFYETFFAYMSLSHPLINKKSIDFKDLDINEMWLLKEGHCFRNQVFNLCSDLKNICNTNSLTFESGSLQTLMNFVEQGHAYTLIPEIATLGLSKEKKKFLKEFSEPKPIRAVSLVMHRSFLKKKLIDTLREEIIGHLPAEMQDRDRGKSIAWRDG